MATANSELVMEEVVLTPLQARYTLKKEDLENWLLDKFPTASYPQIVDRASFKVTVSNLARRNRYSGANSYEGAQDRWKFKAPGGLSEVSHRTKT